MSELTNTLLAMAESEVFELKRKLDEALQTVFRAGEIAGQQIKQISELQAENIALETQVSELLAHCPDAECMECGKIVCPFGEPLHFHHDGCPACDSVTPGPLEQQ